MAKACVVCIAHPSWGASTRASCARCCSTRLNGRFYGVRVEPYPFRCTIQISTARFTGASRWLMIVSTIIKLRAPGALEPLQGSHALLCPAQRAGLDTGM
eukprot:4161748-Pyramimonas_sp.AAC.1